MGGRTREMTIKQIRLYMEQPEPRNIITGEALGFYAIAERIVALHPRADAKALFGLVAWAEM